MTDQGKIVISGISIMAPGIKCIDELKKIFTSNQTLKATNEKERKIDNLSEIARKFIPPMIRRRMSRLSTMTTICLIEALNSAKVEVKDKPDDIAIFYGTGYGELDTTSKIFISGIKEGISPTLFHNSVHNTPVGYGGIVTGIRGPSITISDGFNSGENAIMWATQSLQQNISEIFIAGGSDERYQFPLFVDPNQRKMPGEGCGFVIIEREQNLLNRNPDIKPLCELCGSHLNPFSGDINDKKARIESLIECFEETFSSSRQNHKEGTVIFANHYGNDRDDEILLEAITRFFGNQTPLWSSVNLFGSFPASGALRVVAGAYSLSKKKIPSSSFVIGRNKKEHVSEHYEFDSVLIVGMDIEGDSSSILLKSMDKNS